MGPRTPIARFWLQCCARSQTMPPTVRVSPLQRCSLRSCAWAGCMCSTPALLATRAAAKWSPRFRPPLAPPAVRVPTRPKRLGGEARRGVANALVGRQHRPRGHRAVQPQELTTWDRGPGGMSDRRATNRIGPIDRWSGRERADLAQRGTPVRRVVHYRSDAGRREEL